MGTKGYELVQKEIAQRKATLREAIAERFAVAKPDLLEIGCGHGHFLNAYAQAHPHEQCLGIDIIAKRIEKSLSKSGKRELENIVFMKTEAIEFLECLPEDFKFQKIYILFPDPWPKKRHHKNRLIQEPFLSLARKHIQKDGLLQFRTDDEPYFEWALERIGEHTDWEILQNAPWGFESSSVFQERMGAYQSILAKPKQ